MDWLDLDNLLKLLHTSDISDTPSQEDTHAEMVQFNVFAAFLLLNAARNSPPRIRYFHTTFSKVLEHVKTSRNFIYQSAWLRLVLHANGDSDACADHWLGDLILSEC